MPLLYSINGRPSTYERISEVAPASSSQPAFHNVLQEQMKGADPRLSVEHQAGIRHYEEQGKDLQRKPVLVARDLMSKFPVCVSQTISLEEAKIIMDQNQFHHLPVESSDNQLSGMLSDRDLLKAGEAHFNELVSKYMSVNVLTATPETPIRQIAEAMLKNKIHALPIVDSAHRIVGILTSTDILRAVVQRAPLELWA